MINIIDETKNGKKYPDLPFIVRSCCNSYFLVATDGKKYFMISLDDGEQLDIFSSLDEMFSHNDYKDDTILDNVTLSINY
jgi:hypothetical protein